MTDGKAMVLHDYLIRKVNYSNDGVETECLTEAGALLKNKAKLPGDMHFSRKMLPAYLPEDMDHMWNLVVSMENVSCRSCRMIRFTHPIQSDRDGVVLHPAFSAQ